MLKTAAKHALFNRLGFHTQPNVWHVAVGVIRNGEGEVLIARRHDHLHQGGLWEFPGGKVEPNETVEEALRRELREELGISVEQASPLIRIAHDYGDKRVMLDVWRVDSVTGIPQGMENQPIRWVTVDELPMLTFPAANKPIVAAVRLPEYYPIVDGSLNDDETLFARLERLFKQGDSLVQWRVRTADDAAYLRLARRAVAYCRPKGLNLLLNAEPRLAQESGAAGVHLNSRRLMTLRERPLSDQFWVAASCHSRKEILQAEKIGVDFIVLSPVLATLSHPGANPLGWDRFGAWTDDANLPVFALGGLTRAHLTVARQHGAQGVAGIRGFGEE